MSPAASVARVALPVLFAVSGIVAAVALPSRATESGPSAATVWIDWPTDGAAVEPGTVRVQAHAATTAADATLVLSVDGHAAGKAEHPVVKDGLAYGEIDWTATPGVHDLQVSVGPARSRVHRVNVTAGTQQPTSTPGSEPGPSSTSSLQTTTSSTPSTTAVPDQSAAPTDPSITEPSDTQRPSTAPPGTRTPVTRPPATRPPATTPPPPTIGAIQITGDCTVRVSVPVANTSGVSVRMRATSIGFDQTQSMHLVGGNAVADLTINNAATFQVRVSATGPGGARTSDRTFTNYCKP